MDRKDNCLQVGIHSTIHLTDPIKVHVSFTCVMCVLFVTVKVRGVLAVGFCERFRVNLVADP